MPHVSPLLSRSSCLTSRFPNFSPDSQPKIGYDPDGSGYHFKRHDFDPEWDNDAECTIAEMEFTDNDSELDREHKLRVLQIYNK